MHSMEITPKESGRSIHMKFIHVKSKIRKMCGKIMGPKNNMKEGTAVATWEMSLKFIINYSEYTAASRTVGDRNQELGAMF